MSKDAFKVVLSGESKDVFKVVLSGEIRSR